jgi:hypothetical protein
MNVLVSFIGSTLSVGHTALHHARASTGHTLMVPKPIWESKCFFGETLILLSLEKQSIQQLIVIPKGNVNGHPHRATQPMGVLGVLQ